MANDFRHLYFRFPKGRENYVIDFGTFPTARALLRRTRTFVRHRKKLLSIGGALLMFLFWRYPYAYDPCYRDFYKQARLSGLWQTVATSGLPSRGPIRHMAKAADLPRALAYGALMGKMPTGEYSVYQQAVANYVDYQLSGAQNSDTLRWHEIRTLQASQNLEAAWIENPVMAALNCACDTTTAVLFVYRSEQQHAFIMLSAKYDLDALVVKRADLPGHYEPSPHDFIIPGNEDNIYRLASDAANLPLDTVFQNAATPVTLRVLSGDAVLWNAEKGTYVPCRQCTFFYADNGGAFYRYTSNIAQVVIPDSTALENSLKEASYAPR